MAIKDFIKKFYIYFLIFFLGLGFRIYALSTRPPLHIDEPSSFVVSTIGNELDQGSKFKNSWNYFNFKYDKEYKAEDIQKAFFVAEKSPSSIIRDLQMLRNNNIDRQHPTLYHSILRLWNLPLGDFDFQKYLNHARNLNLIFYVISFFFMFKLLSLIKDDKKFISLGLFCGFLNSGGIMLDTMAREYALTEALLIITTYIAFIIGKKIINNEEIEFKNIFIYPICFSLFLSSCYLSVIYMVIISCILVILCICYKRKILFIQTLAILLFTVCITTLIYPDYFDFSSNNEHYNPAKSNISSIVKTNLIASKMTDFAKHINKYIFSRTLCYFIICIAILFFIFPSEKICSNKHFNKKELISILSILGCATLWAVLVNYTVEYRYYARYIMPAVSIYCLLIVLFVYRFKPLFTIIIAIFITYSTFSQIKYNNITDGDRIKYNNNRNSQISANTLLPPNKHIIIVKPSHYPIEHLMFGCVKPETTVIFKNELPNKDFKYKNYILVCNKNLIKNKRYLFTIRGDLRIFDINDINKNN